MTVLFIPRADELGMVMLCRAILDDKRDIPFVYMAYNIGKGRDTIPAYSNEKIGDDMDNTIIAAGGMQIPAPERAELILAINTNPDGKTGEANSPANTTKPRQGTKPFVNMVKDFVSKGYPTAVADIAYGNGADNALMNELHKADLQFKLLAYGGWNTATNTTGFLLGTGLLAKWMDRPAQEELMLTRYLEDWGYQANVRQSLGSAVWSQPGYNQATGNLDGAYLETDVALQYAKNYPDLAVILEVPYDAAGSVVGVYKGNAALLHLLQGGG